MKKNKTQKQTKKVIGKSLFSLIFIGLPAILISIFSSQDFSRSFDVPYWVQIIISIIFFGYAILISFLFFMLKKVKLNILTFSIPIAIVFISIYLTDDLFVKNYSITNAIRFGIVFGIIFLTIPLNIIIHHSLRNYHQNLIKEHSKKHNSLKK